MDRFAAGSRTVQTSSGRPTNVFRSSRASAPGWVDSSKTEFLLGLKQQLAKINSCLLGTIHSARNLGSISDEHLSYYRAACMQRSLASSQSTRKLSVRLSVCLSFRLSICQTGGLWQDESKLCPHSYTTLKIIYPSFVTKKAVGGGNRF